MKLVSKFANLFQLKKEEQKEVITSPVKLYTLHEHILVI